MNCSISDRYFSALSVLLMSRFLLPHSGADTPNSKAEHSLSQAAEGRTGYFEQRANFHMANFMGYEIRPALIGEAL